MGGMIWGISSALHEATEIDRKRARYVNDNLADYLMPVNADIQELQVILVPEEDDKVNPAGVKGIGEIANVGTAAAIANAVYHGGGARPVGDREALDGGFLDQQLFEPDRQLAHTQAGSVSIHASQAALPPPLPLALGLFEAPLARRLSGRVRNGTLARPLLPRMLLGALWCDACCCRDDEHRLDACDDTGGIHRKGVAARFPYLSGPWIDRSRAAGRNWCRPARGLNETP